MPGELVKARRTLKQIREDIVEAAKTLGATESRNEELKSENGAIEKDNESKRAHTLSLDEEIEQKRRELGILDQAIEGRRFVVISIDESAEASALSLSEIERQAKELLDQVAVLALEQSSAKRDLAGKQLLREKFESDIRNLIGQKISLEQAVARLVHEITDATQKKDGVMGAIEEALENFRIFERRINQFSQETGYMVGYKRPEALLDNK